MLNKLRKFERGQSLVVVTILMIVFIGILALVIDGGYTYFMRRNAQNAADAGALAGADIYCGTEIWSNGVDGAKEIAEYYAIDINNADTAIAIPVGERMVQVDTTISFDPIFGRFFRDEPITVPASATAGCYPPALAEGVIPVAWSCRKPVVEAYPPPDPDDPPDHEWSSDDCKFLYGDEDYPYTGQIYIIMDANKLFDDYDTYAACQDPPYDPDCTEEGCVELNPDQLDCDIDNDGVNDIMSGGERSWLDLDGGSSSAVELSRWILKEEVPPIQTHLWLVGSDGGKTSVYQAAETLEGHDAILPVFNHHCDMKNDPGGAKMLEDTVCYQEWSDIEEQEDPKLGESTSGDYFHVITFAVFHVTCVSDTPGKTCPVKDEAIAANLADHNTFTIEGYFVSGYTPSAGGGPNDNPWVGAYTVYLIK